MNVSVIICAYTIERLGDIHEAVNSVLAQTLKPHEVILAVDHNKELFERLKAELPAEVKVVLNEGAPGLSGTRNVGIRSSTGEIVAFLDDDAVAEPDWLANLAMLFEDPKVIGAGGQAILRWEKGRPFWFPEEIDWMVGGSSVIAPPQRMAVRNPHGHNMCFQRSMVLAVGGFGGGVGAIGEARRDAEEAELSLRLSEHYPVGVIMYEPKARILHKVPAGRGRWRYVIRRSYQQGMSKALIQRLCHTKKGKTLSNETVYLRYLLTRAIPSRILRFWQPRAIPQATMITASVGAVGLGYAVGRTRRR